MNRRRFIQSVVAVLSLPAAPALSFRAATSALPAAAAVPAQARSWAIYMSTLHGECTPQTLQNLLNIPAADARSYVTQLIADGALKPNPLLQKSVSELVKTKDGNLFDKFKRRLEMKAQTETEELKTVEVAEASEDLDIDMEPLDNDVELGLDPKADDEFVEDGTDAQSDAEIATQPMALSSKD